MPGFMCLVQGTGYTSFVHPTIDNAITEATRLHEMTKGRTVTILEVVGVIKIKEVPVIEKKMVIELDERLKKDDLPF